MRAGRDDFTGLNAALDRFVSDALRSNLPITVIAHADAAHGFDSIDDRAETRHVIEHVLTFLRHWLFE